MVATIEIEPLNSVIGAEVRGVSLTEPLDADLAIDLRQALAEHSVLVFRDQEGDPPAYERFAANFGSVHVQTLGFGLPRPNTAGVMALDAPAKPGGRPRWHTDETWLEVPPKIGMLRAVEMPAVGGNTCFSSMYAAYDALSPSMKAVLEPIVGVYTGDYASRDFRRTQADSPERQVLNEEMANKASAFPPVTHPLVQVHPESGRKHLFFSCNALTRLQGFNEAESDALIQFLFQHIQLPAFQLRFQWRPGTIAAFDERSTQHYVVPDYVERRVMERIYIEG
jgi:taurine dioxygenase